MNAPARITAEPASWAERNQRWLAARIARLRERLEPTGDLPAAEEDDEGFRSALDRCAEVFGLSRFERELLLLCAGVALDGGLAKAVAAVAGAPTFSLAMSLLDDAHWDAMSPQAPLRYFRLLVLRDASTPALAPLCIDERILHYITGVAALDERLEAYVEPLAAPLSADAAPSWVRQVVTAFADGNACVQLIQPGGIVTREQVLALLAAAQRPALWIKDLPDDANALAGTLRLLDREAALSSALLVLDFRGALGGEGASTSLSRALRAALHSPRLVLGVPEGHTEVAADESTRHVVLPARTPSTQADELAARALKYGATLPLDALRECVAESCEQFVSVRPRALDEAARSLAEAPGDRESISRRAWAALRSSARGGLDQLAQRIDSNTSLEHLVLPNAQRKLLAAIGQQLLHRRRVYRDWGFATRGARGLGLAALFTGESGTGKTMAAEAIANAAGLDLYRIDLASTVSKYIGETEKNLKRIFDAAEHSGAVLLFDEADALFGKRSEVKDSHDRYANVETAYLLQRIEAYRGLALLTTNMKGALDRAFLRRIRFVVQFPFPDENARAELWRRQLPKEAPQSDDIRWDALARLHLTGGHIRSVALNAAFMAAHEGSAICQAHLMAAAHAELAKLERSPGHGGRA